MFYSEYGFERDLMERNQKEVRSDYTQICSDTREAMSQDVREMCVRWKSTLETYASVGIRNIAVASVTNRWFGHLADGVGDILLRHYPRLAMVTSILFFATALLFIIVWMGLTKITKAYSQRNIHLPFVLSGHTSDESLAQIGYSNPTSLLLQNDGDKKQN